MTSVLPTKKLLTIAIFSSAIIGAVAISPHTIMHPISLNETFKIAFLLTALIFVVWLVNIALVLLYGRFADIALRGNSRYLFSYIICVTIVVFARTYLSSDISHAGINAGYNNNHSSGLTHNRESMFASFILGFAYNTIVLLIQDLILLREKKAKVELENAELKIKNVQATNQQLKQQIHPHFLFNSLNTLKTLIKKQPDQAEDYLQRLSDFLRASFLSNTPNTVELWEEIKPCYDYLEMQKMRFGDALQYTINIADEIQHSVCIPVFSLLPLLENAIKHNKLTKETPLHIHVEYENGRITTTNNIQPKTLSEPSTGLGLQNLQERYDILSGDKVIVNNDGKTFSVSIKALSNANSNYRR